MVYVTDINGQPLMPTDRHGKVRRLLKSDKAKVVRRCPFTIQLLYSSTNYTQPVTLGMDTGIKHTGVCASTEDKVLYQCELLQRGDVSGNLKSRGEFRRARRNRKTRYRKARFLNRVHSKHKGWVAPSVEQLIRSHVKECQSVTEILPVTKIRVETAEFDIHKIKDPTVKGVQYQFGEKHGFEQNTRNYVLFRDNHRCRHCGSTKGKLYVMSADGKPTTAPEDLYTFCRECYLDICRGNIKIPKKRYFSPPTKMGIMRDALLKRLRDTFDIPVEKTTGAETKLVRKTAGIPKSHINDAYVIAGNIRAKSDSTWYLKLRVRCHNRQLHKATIQKGGIRKLNQAPKYVKGFQLFDKVIYNRQECFIFGRRSSGYFDLRLLDGTKIHRSASVKNIKLLERGRGRLIQRMSF